MQYKNIIVALEGGPSSTLVLQQAFYLAKLAQAKLYIIHVADVLLPPTADVGYITINLDEYKKAVIIRGEKLLKKIKESINRSDIEIETKLIENEFNRISEKIIQATGELSGDLLVLGTHGRRGFNRFLMGSVAEEVVRIAKTPVLLVREKSD